MRSARLLMGLAALAASGSAKAQSLTVTTELSETQAEVGDVVTLEVVARAQSAGALSIEVPRIRGLHELRRHQSESTQMSWTSAGNSLTRERHLRIDYEPRRSGKIEIPPFEATVGRERAKSAPLVLEVLKSGAQEEQAPTASPGRVEPPGPEERDLFVRYRVDRSKVYLGQQILVDLEIYTRGGSFNLERTQSPPALDGFWREIIDEPKQLRSRIQRVGRQEYRVYRLWRTAYFPLEAGERTLKKLSLDFTVNRGIFSSGRSLRRTVPPVKIDVEPLPQKGRPKGFVSTNVGRLSFAARVDQSKVKAGKAVVLTLTVSGLGNISNLKLPEVKDIDGFRVFPPTLSEQLNREERGVVGSKTAEMILVPQRGGRLEIPAISMTVFDPDKEEYLTLTTDSIRVTVDGDPKTSPTVLPPPPGAPPTTRPAAAVTGDDLHPLRFRSELADRGGWKRDRGLALALFLAAPLLFLLGLLGETAWARARKPSAASKRRQTTKEAVSRLAAARDAADGGMIGDAYAAVSDALLDLGSERSGVALRGLLRPEMAEALVGRGVDAEVARGLVRVLEACEHGRFAPGASRSDVARVIDQAEPILSALAQWKGGKA